MGCGYANRALDSTWRHSQGRTWYHFAVDWPQLGLLLLIGLAGGVFGGMMGLGGGAFVVPLLTLALGLPMHVAIATSLVAVTATACTAAAAYVRARFTNIRLGLLLETTTV
ncbi:MAG: TSUP family transporter, partial [Chloroflexota bacterium]